MTTLQDRTPLKTPFAPLRPIPAPRARSKGWRSWMLPVALPIALIAVILTADSLEGPKTAYVGVLAVIPMLSAVFGRPSQTAIVGAVAWLSALCFGWLASDGNVMAQEVRLVIIAISAFGAVFAARHRLRREQRLADAELTSALVEQMREQATTDMLTGALNRRGVVDALNGAEHTTPYTLALADCDRFKLVNDVHGHQAGDRYLRATAKRITHGLSQQDLIGRWGGDEFLMVLPLPLDEARTVLERVHTQVTDKPVESDGVSLDIGITVGAVEWLPGEDIDSAVARADRALLEGKREGRGRLVIE